MFAPINARLASSCSGTGSGTHRRIPPAGWIRPCSQLWSRLNKLDSPLLRQVTGLLRSGLLHRVGVRTGDNVVAFFDSRQVVNFVSYNTVGHFTIRSLKEAVFVSLCVHGQRVDQTDVRTFRGFDWTYATVVSRVYVSNFEACTFTGQTTGRVRRYDVCA